MRVAALFSVLAASVMSVRSHGVITYPPARGLVPGGVRDYCAHCLNAGGPTAVHSNGWHPYQPMSGGPKLGNFGMCGDRAGEDAHTRSGIYANPPSQPFSATYAPGGVIDLTWYMNANHKGYLELYICDVDKLPGNDISYKGFNTSCQGPLRREPHPSCESGKDLDCGPVDERYPGRFVFPCGTRTFGGDGKMAFRLPNLEIPNGVLQAYWMTANSCTNPDGFMQQYAYPEVWSGCGTPVDMLPVCGPTNKPEEFWICVDVRVTQNPSNTSPPYPQPLPTPRREQPKSSTVSSVSDTKTLPVKDEKRRRLHKQRETTDRKTREADISRKPGRVCKKKWRACEVNKDCVQGACENEGLICGSYFGSGYMCVKDGPNVQPVGCSLYWRPCTLEQKGRGKQKDPCCPGSTCSSFYGSSSMCVPASAY